MDQIILGFSGGVDSAVSAVLLREMGYSPICVYLHIGDETALEEAKRGAEQLKMPFIAVNAGKRLAESVEKEFEISYLSGETPIPCILCNPAVKFAMLLEQADSFGIRQIATGHYARTESGKLFRGHPDNDQSYMLCRLLPEQLRRTVFPLAGLNKAGVRELALRNQLVAAKKPDSAEICFIPSNDYRAWLKSRGNVPVPGPMLFHGEQIGEHEGIWMYTVGQRIPGFYDGRKRYVSRIDADNNTVELALWEELFKTELTVSAFNWLVDPPVEPISASVRVRHTRWEEPSCVAEPVGELVRIRCSEPVRAPAPGQSAVLYSGSQVLGGGFIR